MKYRVGEWIAYVLSVVIGAFTILVAMAGLWVIAIQFAASTVLLVVIGRTYRSFRKEVSS